MFHAGRAAGGKLSDLGIIELVRTEQRRGAVKHFYRPTARAMLTDRQWARLPIEVRRQLFGHNLDQIWSHTLNEAMDIQAGVVNRRVKGEEVGDVARTELVQLHFLPQGERKP